jgi:hypothetical protein
MFINMTKGQEFMKVNPRTVATIQRDHKTFFQNKPRPRTGIYAIGTSYYPGSACIAEADDFPSLTFDDNIYMFHLADGSSVDAADESPLR